MPGPELASLDGRFCPAVTAVLRAGGEKTTSYAGATLVPACYRRGAPIDLRGLLKEDDAAEAEVSPRFDEPTGDGLRRGTLRAAAAANREEISSPSRLLRRIFPGSAAQAGHGFLSARICPPSDLVSAKRSVRGQPEGAPQ